MKGHIAHLCFKKKKKKQRRWTQLGDFCGAEANKYGMTFEITQMLESVTAAIILLTSTIFTSALHSSLVINRLFFSCLEQPLAYRAHSAAGEVLNEMEN